MNQNLVNLESVGIHVISLQTNSVPTMQLALAGDSYCDSSAFKCAVIFCTIEIRQHEKVARISIAVSL